MNNVQSRSFASEVIDVKDGLLSQDQILLSEDIDVCWKEVLFDHDNKVKIHEKNTFMELHFQFNGFSKTFFDKKELILYPNSQTIFHVTDFIGEHELHKDNFNPLTLFEIKIGENAVNRMFPKEMWNEIEFIQNIFYDKNAYINSIKPISPQMYCTICEMRNNPFKGIMGRLYLEAKIVELFLLQAESHKLIQNRSLRKEEIEKIMSAKEFIDKNYQTKIRIIDLAKIVGTNQQMLKKGFKEMFKTTIFSYYNDLRMKMAKSILIDGRKNVAEVSNEIGYKNPQHFTVAFKKRFGILPKDLK